MQVSPVIPPTTAPTSKPSKSKSSKGWSAEKSAELYGVEAWGHKFFGVNKDGHVTVKLEDGEHSAKVSLHNVIEGLRDRGTHLPVLLRFRDLLHSRITEINEAFREAIKETKYQGNYRGVYPIKVNQQRQVIEEIAEFGKKYHYGLEAGSKPELIAALAHMHDPDAYIICNGYKDEEFIDLALHSQKMGMKIMLVLEMPSELDLILERSRKIGVLPNLGIRIRLSTKGSGHWQESAGDKSVFGLNAAQVIGVVDSLKASGHLPCLKMLHYHQGSQIPNIAAIREGATEAVRIYCDLVKEGAPMGVLDIGGGMAVDYDGSHTNFASSCNYSIQEYCTDIIEVVSQQCDRVGVPHPNLISESGRAVVSYYSVLVFNILDVTSAQTTDKEPEMPKNAPQNLANLFHVNKTLSKKNLQEAMNDAVYYRDQVRAMFLYGSATLRERGLAEAWYWHISSNSQTALPISITEISHCSNLSRTLGQSSNFFPSSPSIASTKNLNTAPFSQTSPATAMVRSIASSTKKTSRKSYHYMNSMRMSLTTSEFSWSVPIRKLSATFTISSATPTWLAFISKTESLCILTRSRATPSPTCSPMWSLTRKN